MAYCLRFRPSSVPLREFVAWVSEPPPSSACPPQRLRLHRSRRPPRTGIAGRVPSWGSRPWARLRSWGGNDRHRAVPRLGAALLRAGLRPACLLCAAGLLRAGARVLCAAALLRAGTGISLRAGAGLLRPVTTEAVTEAPGEEPRRGGRPSRAHRGQHLGEHILDVATDLPGRRVRRDQHRGDRQRARHLKTDILSPLRRTRRIFLPPSSIGLLPGAARPMSAPVKGDGWKRFSTGWPGPRPRRADPQALASSADLGGGGAVSRSWAIVWLRGCRGGGRHAHRGP